MPRTSHVGISLKIEGEAERERLKQVVASCVAAEGIEEQGGFILRTAAEGAGKDEILVDIRYLRRLWEQIGSQIQTCGAPTVIYEDLGLALRTLRDLVNPKIEKIRIDSRETFQKTTQFVAELMPTYPVYVPLLPGAAQQVMGQIHPQSELPFAALLHEGFEAERYIDIFDGGAVLTADARNVATIAGSRRWPVVISASMPTNPHVWLVANGKSVDFRVVQTPACLWHGQLWITPEVAEALLVSTSDLVCAIREEVAA